METTLVANPGSSSRKYALYCDGKVVLEIRFEDLRSGFEMCSQISGEQKTCEAISESDFSDSFARVDKEVEKYLSKEKIDKLETVAIRVVAPGTFFQKHRLVDDEYIEKLREKEKAAPLHVPLILREIKQARKYFKQVRVVAVSDSAFHADMPSCARNYSISERDAEGFDIYRFGYHGLSVSSIVRKIHALIGIDPEKMIVAHIGSGTSVTAVKSGKSIETTMGFSPTSGLPMSSRAGDLDAVALLELMRVKNLRPSDAEVYLNTNGGLLGIAGESDIRLLLDRRSQENREAGLALDKFAYSIKKAIASSSAALGGVDVLVFTATASVRSPELRALILNGLEYLGIKLSPDRNDLLMSKDGVISVRNSPVKVVVIRTDEMGEMAIAANQFINEVVEENR
jgi:acetate kinase